MIDFGATWRTKITTEYLNIVPATNVTPDIIFYSQDTNHSMSLATTTNNSGAGDFFIMPSNGTTMYFRNNGLIECTDVYSFTGNKYLSKASQPSDRRLKRDITDIDVDEFDRIYNLLKPKQFYWKDEVKEKEQKYITDNGLTYGFIAQEIPEELKNWVYTDPIGYPQNNSMGFSKTVCKCCEKEIKHECCCEDNAETKEVWCNEGCCIENEDISGCECDEDGCMGIGMRSIDYTKLIPLNYIAIQRTNEKMTKLLKEEQDRNAALEVRLQKLETMIVSIMTKLS